MSTADSPNPVATPTPTSPGRMPWPELLKKLAIWGLFFAVLYLIRDFFFLAFFTFLFSYLALHVVGWMMKRLSPDRNRPGVRRLVTLGVFVLAPMLLLAAGAVVMPTLIAQGQRLIGWLSRVDPETEAARLVEGYVGPAEFRRQFGGPDDPRYQKGLADFRSTGETHVAAYLGFPQLEAWVEGSFGRQFADRESARIKARLLSEGTSGKDFERWYLAEKAPQLQAEARKESQAKGKPATVVTPEELLQQARRDPSTIAALQREWINDASAKELAAAKESPAYREQLQKHYDDLKAHSPKALPYSFDDYIDLQSARTKGSRAFGDMMQSRQPDSADAEAALRADFEAAKEHDLFQAWWCTSSLAHVVRHQVESGGNWGDAGRLERYLASTLDVPLDIATAMLLSFFICIDFPAIQRAGRRLRDTWLRDVYDELAPALTSLGLLIGRAMQAQGLIAFCNAMVMFFALVVLGVEHAALLAAAVFVLCLVPTIGTVIAWVLISAVALLQLGGGLMLVLKVTAAVVFVVLLETFVFSPRILGKMMELHPVLIIALLPLAQYFFGVWGLILATPVAVFVIHDVILRSGLPGGRSTAADGKPAADRFVTIDVSGPSPRDSGANANPLEKVRHES
jgi:predicted PurR-regulated permease PerM